VAKEDETFGLQNSKCFPDRDETGSTPFGDLLRQNLGIASIATGDDAVSKVLDNMRNGTVVRSRRSSGTALYC
jgi:hypothetical protein